MAGLLVSIIVVIKMYIKNLGITHEPTVGADQVGAERGGEGGIKGLRGWEGVVLEHGFINGWSIMVLHVLLYLMVAKLLTELHYS
jgi:hypothetical protein